MSCYSLNLVHGLKKCKSHQSNAVNIVNTYLSNNTFTLLSVLFQKLIKRYLVFNVLERDILALSFFRVNIFVKFLTYIICNIFQRYFHTHLPSIFSILVLVSKQEPLLVYQIIKSKLRYF